MLIYILHRCSHVINSRR